MSIRYDIITIFPKLFGPYLNESILKRAQQKKLISIRIHDLRDFTKDKRKTVDDKAYGGGPGMVLKAEPILQAIKKITLKNKKPLVIFTSATGKPFTAKLTKTLSKQKQIIFVAGRYEGIDERAQKVIKNLKFKIENLSIGPYVLTGGELPALVMIDAISRHIPGVLGKQESLEEKRGGAGIPTYTRPETFIWPFDTPRQARHKKAQGKQKTYRVPPILLSGDHKKIETWRQSKRKKQDS